MEPERPDAWIRTVQGIVLGCFVGAVLLAGLLWYWFGVRGYEVLGP